MLVGNAETVCASGPTVRAPTVFWLTSLLLKEFNLSLHKGTFRDAIALRYGWLTSNLMTNCSCGSTFSVQHALSCPTGGFPTLQHNEVRDLTADPMAEACHDVCTEPSLQTITGETLLEHPPSALRMEQGWRLLPVVFGPAATIVRSLTLG